MEAAKCSDEKEIVAEGISSMRNNPFANTQGMFSIPQEVVNLLTTMSVRLPPPPSSPPPPEKRSLPSMVGPFLHPLPTIETIMAYPGLTRPTYDSIVRGEPPAQAYHTIIHTPKPLNLRLSSSSAKGGLGLILARAAELRDERVNGCRSRSDTMSSDGSMMTARSYEDSESSFGGDNKDTADASIDVLSPPSPTGSTSSTSRATVSSSPPSSPAFPLAEAQATNSRSSSPAASFRSSVSTLSSLYESYSSTTTTPSSADHSATTSAYPSPPSSPHLSRSSSSSEEWMPYPSPPDSPSAHQNPHSATRARRASSFPPPPGPSLLSQPPTRLRASTVPSLPAPFPAVDLGGDLEPIDEDVEDDLEWSMNGGEVVFGAAGVAVSPRAMRGLCCHCDCRGLGLYVIEEEEEVQNVVESVEEVEMREGS